MEFGLARFVGFIQPQRGLPVPETLRRLVHSVLDYRNGRLQDDATVLFLEWHGPRATPRSDSAVRRNLLPHTKGARSAPLPG